MATTEDRVRAYIAGLTPEELPGKAVELGLENIRLRKVIEAVQGAYGEFAGLVEMSTEGKGAGARITVVACCAGGDEEKLARAFAAEYGRVLNVDIRTTDAYHTGTLAMGGGR